MNDIYLLDPINRTAALATNQSGCASDGTLSDEQLRENLVIKAKQLQSALILFPKNSKERKLLGLEKSKIEKKINSIRPKRTAKGVDQYFIDAARDLLTRTQFNTLMNLAVKKLKESEINLEVSK